MIGLFLPDGLAAQVVDGEFQHFGAGAVLDDVGFRVVAVGEVFPAQGAEAGETVGVIGQDADAAEADDALDVIPPVAGLLFRLVQDREAGLVAGAESVQLVAFPGAVKVEFPVLENEVDGHGVGISAIADDGEEAPVAAGQDPEAFFLREGLLRPAHGPENGLHPLLEPVHPGLDVGLGGAVQGLAGFPVDFGIGLGEVLVGLVDGTAAGGGEEDDRLAFEAVGLEEGVDDGRGRVPPDREAEVDHVIAVGVLEVLHDGRAGALVLHFDGAAGGLVAPVQVGGGVLDFRLDLVEGAAGDFGEVLGHGLGGAGGGEIGDEGFHLFLVVLAAGGEGQCQGGEGDQDFVHGMLLIIRFGCFRHRR